MSKYKMLAFVSLALACSVSLAARTAATKISPPTFSSVYTNLNTECKNAFRSVGEGQDMPLRCKGYGGYSVYIYYSAFGSHIAIQSKNKSDDSPAIASQGLDYSDQKGRKVEWRMANGKPFAVILRISNYEGEPTEPGESPFSDKYKKGESLIVKGLKGYERIDFTLDAKPANANVKAREMADQAYAGRKQVSGRR